MAEVCQSKPKVLIKNTFTLYIRMVLSMFIGFFSSRILLNQLGVQDFGIFNVIAGLLIILGFLNTTLTLSTQRFLNFALGEESKEKAQKVFSSSLVIHFFLAVVILLFAETIGLWFLNTQMNIPSDRIEAANIVYQTTIVATMLQICQVPFVAAIIARERMTHYASICIVDIFLRFMSALTLMIVSYDKLIVYSLLIMSVAIINIAIYATYCRKNFEETEFSLCKDKLLYRKMLMFSSWNIFSAISISVNGQVINVLLNIFFGPVVNAARGVAVQAGGAISGLVGNFQVAVNPQIIKLYASEQYDNFRSLIKRSSKFSYFLLLVLALPISFKIDDILELWLVDVPDYAPAFCLLILASNLINSFSLPLATAANATGDIKKFQIYTGVFELLNIPVSLLLLLLDFSPYSVFVVNLVITGCTLCVRMYILKSLIGLGIKDFIKTTLLRSFAVTFICIPLIYMISTWFQDKHLVYLCLYFCSSILMILFITYLLGLNKEERNFIKQVVKSKLKK